VLRRDGATTCGPVPADEWIGCDIGYVQTHVTYLVYDANGSGTGDDDVYASE
jgi:hypothetical protein